MPKTAAAKPASPEVNSIVSTFVILLVIGCILFVGYRALGGASRAPKSMPIATQPNPGGPPANAMRPTRGGWGSPPVTSSAGFTSPGNPYYRR